MDAMAVCAAILRLFREMILRGGCAVTIISYVLLVVCIAANESYK